MKRLVTSVAAIMAISAAFATTSPTPKKAAYEGKSWVINVGVGFPQGDAEDAGFKTAWIVGADYVLGAMGNDTNTSTYIGAKAYFSDGDDDETFRAYGVHYGVLFGLGDKTGNVPLRFKLEAGYYNSRFDDGFQDDKWGLGGAAALVWEPKSSSGMNWRLEGGYFFLPAVNDTDAKGWYFAIGFPFGSK